MTTLQWNDAPTVHGKKCIIAGLFSAKDENVKSYFLHATKTIEKCGGNVVGRILQRRGVSRASKPGGIKRMSAPMNAATFIGQGKAQELKELVSSESAEVVVFLNELSGTQKRNLIELTGCNLVVLESS